MVGNVGVRWNEPNSARARNAPRSASVAFSSRASRALSSCHRLQPSRINCRSVIPWEVSLLEPLPNLARLSRMLVIHRDSDVPLEAARLDRSKPLAMSPPLMQTS